LNKQAENVSTPTDRRLDPSGLRAHLGPLLLLTTIFFVNFMARVVYAPLLPEITGEMALSHAQAGSLFFFISSGYFAALFGSGWVAAALTHRRTIALSALFLGTALFGTAFSGSLGTLRASLLLLGAAAGLYLPSGIATLTDLIPPARWGKAIAVHELAPNLGFVAAPLLAEALLLRLPWRAVPVVLGLAALLLAICFGRYGRGGEFAGLAPGLGAFRPFLSTPAFWIMVLLFALGISSTLGVYTMLPLFLVTEHGIDRNLANSLISVSRISGLLMALAGGWASDRFGPRRTLVVVFLLTGLSTIGMGLSNRSMVTVTVFLQPLMAVCFFPAGFAALSAISPAGSRNIAVSLAIPAAFLVGGGAVPALIGFMGDRYSFALGISLVGGMILTGAALSMGLRRRSDS
jgi:NNP family nitrate/nitrite transporter-like MFS transporter